MLGVTGDVDEFETGENLDASSRGRPWSTITDRPISQMDAHRTRTACFDG